MQDFTVSSPAKQLHQTQFVRALVALAEAWNATLIIDGQKDGILVSPSPVTYGSNLS